MKTTIYYALSEKGRREAAKNGLDAREFQIIETEISEKEKEYFDLVHIKSDGTAILQLCNGDPARRLVYNTVTEFDSVQSPQELLKYKKELLEKEKKEEKEIQEKRKKSLAQAKEKLFKLEHYKEAYNHNFPLVEGKRYIVLEISYNGFLFKFVDNDNPRRFPDDVTHVDLSRFQRQYDQELERLQAEENKAAREKQEHKKVIAEGREKLLNWAKENGTALLKARIEENLNWFHLANKEYLLSFIPEGFDDLPNGFVDDEGIWDNASLEAISKVREIRKSFANKDCFVCALPKFYKYEIEDDFYEYENERYKTIYTVDITLRSPTLFEETFSLIF